jgi:hypothetical protein
MPWLIERAGVCITIRAESVAAERLIKDALANLRARPVEQDRGAVLSVTGDENGWQLTDHTRDISRAPDTTGALVYQLTSRIGYHLAAGANRHHCLHAAAVSHGGRALVMPANSGSGKSSLTLWLVTRGFEYITDEMTLIDERCGVDGLARHIQIKYHGLQAIEALINCPKDIYRGKWSSAIPLSCLGGHVAAQERYDLGLFLFPQFKEGAGYCLSRVSQAEAGLKLMGSHINARNLKDHGFGALMALVRASPCYTLEYGGFDCLPEDFDDQLCKLLETGADAEKSSAKL